MINIAAEKPIPRKRLIKAENNNPIEESKDEVKLQHIKSKETSKCPLSLRKDVVYKTLIRSLKRYLTEK